MSSLYSMQFVCCTVSGTGVAHFCKAWLLGILSHYVTDVSKWVSLQKCFLSLCVHLWCGWQWTCKEPVLSNSCEFRAVYTIHAAGLNVELLLSLFICVGTPNRFILKQHFASAIKSKDTPMYRIHSSCLRRVHQRWSWPMYHMLPGSCGSPWALKLRGS